MKKMAISFLVCLFSTLGFSQENHEAVSNCDSTFIFDYRMIYNDYVSDSTTFFENNLSDRYNAFFFGKY
jgi:hypothetical protein